MRNLGENLRESASGKTAGDERTAFIFVPPPPSYQCRKGGGSVQEGQILLLILLFLQGAQDNLHGSIFTGFISYLPGTFTLFATTTLNCIKVHQYNQF